MRKRFEPCTDPAKSSYEVAADGRSIRFMPCGITSFHPKDVQHRFCALCHRFLDEKL